MRLNNVYSKKNSRDAEAGLILGSIFLIYDILYSVFFGFDAFIENCGEIWMIVFGIPVVGFSIFIFNLFEGRLDSKDTVGGENIRYIDFSPFGINLKFCDPKFDKTYRHDEIDSLHLDFVTQKKTYKGEVCTILCYIKCNFKLVDGKSFSIKTNSSNTLKFVYKLIDNARGIPDFSYTFSGEGPIENLKECMDAYIRTGYKQVLTSAQRKVLKEISITFFFMGVLITCMLHDAVSGMLQALFAVPRNIDACIFFGMFIFLVGILYMVSFVSNVLLIVDKILDKKYGIINNLTTALDKLPCELIAGVQTAIFFALVYFFAKPYLF